MVDLAFGDESTDTLGQEACAEGLPLVLGYHYLCWFAVRLGFLSQQILLEVTYIVKAPCSYHLFQLYGAYLVGKGRRNVLS